MVGQWKATAFDIDQESMVSLRQAFPDWEIEAVTGATAASLAMDWNPAVVHLLIVAGGDPMDTTLGLCRGLRSQAGRATTPIVVLVPPRQEGLVRAALEAGASSCLVLPIHPKELVSMISRAQAEAQPGRHTLDLNPAQKDDPWQDDGGES